MNVFTLKNRRPKSTPHLVEDVHFAHGQPEDAAPLSCACGWSGTVGEWFAHSGRGMAKVWGKTGWAGPESSLPQARLVRP